MVFVSNNHVLVRFKFKECVTFKSNGSVVNYSNQAVQRKFQDSPIIGQSFLQDGIKYLSYEYHETDIIALKFYEKGKMKVVGFCQDYLK